MAYTTTNSIQILAYSRVTSKPPPSPKEKRKKVESPPVLREEFVEAVCSLKAGKSPGVDNSPSELLENGGEATTTVLTAVCQNSWETKKWPMEWTQSLFLPLPKKGNFKQCQNYRTISLFSHPSEIMLRVILNRLKTKNCWQKNRSSIDDSSLRRTYNISAICSTTS